MSDENNNDHLRLVADNKAVQPQREQAEQEAKVKAKVEQAKDDLARSMNWLAANILRLIAGGGKSYELVDQFAAMIKAYDAMVRLREVYDYAAITPAVEALGRTDSWERLQSEGGEHFQRSLDDGTVSVARSEDAIIQAALRIVAAEFLGQATQRSTAESAFYEAIERFNEARETKNKGWLRRLSEEREQEEVAARAGFRQQFPLQIRVRLKVDSNGRAWTRKKRTAAAKGATGIVVGHSGATARVRWDEQPTGQTFCYGADEIARID
jgi:hypothetical protein